MIVDFHTHIFPEKIAGKTLEKLSEMSNEPYYSGATADSLLASMEKAQVDLSIALPVVTAPRQFDSINRFAAEVNARYYDGEKHTGILSLGGIHPDCEDYKEKLRQIKELGLPGIKLHPVYQQVSFDDIRYMRIVDYASELELCVVAHAGYDVGFPGADFVSPSVSKHLIETVHPQNLILAHMGGYGQWSEVEEELAGLPVYLDASYALGKMADEQFLRLIEKHGAGQILFATDCPWMDQREQAEKLKSLPLSQDQKEQILWKNAFDILGFC